MGVFFMKGKKIALGLLIGFISILPLTSCYETAEVYHGSSVNTSQIDITVSLKEKVNTDVRSYANDCPNESLQKSINKFADKMEIKIDGSDYYDLVSISNSFEYIKKTYEKDELLPVLKRLLKGEYDKYLESITNDDIKILCINGLEKRIEDLSEISFSTVSKKYKDMLADKEAYLVNYIVNNAKSDLLYRYRSILSKLDEYDVSNDFSGIFDSFLSGYKNKDLSAFAGFLDAADVVFKTAFIDGNYDEQLVNATKESYRDKFKNINNLPEEMLNGLNSVINNTELSYNDEFEPYKWERAYNSFVSSLESKSLSFMHIFINSFISDSKAYANKIKTESLIGEIKATYIENIVQMCERNKPNYFKLDSYITFCSLYFTRYYYSVRNAKAEYEASKTQ